jgi:hypothetical protein
MSKRPPLRIAIDSHCADCIYDPIQVGTWRQQVEKCTSPKCALYCVRPTPIAYPRVKERSLILESELALKGPVSGTQEVMV